MEIFDETVREDEEESGLTRGGARFRQEKRQRTGESSIAIKKGGHEGIPHGTNQPYND